MEKKFDVLIWGATGFTGKYVAEYLVKKENISLGLAGRDEKKLTSLKNHLMTLDSKAKNIELITADSTDLDSLKKMAAQASVVCNCVGPYLKHGLNIIEACVEGNAHYCDLCGEVPWIKDVISNYHDKAKEKNLKIVPSCGFDSIPSDLGVFLLQKESIEKEGKPLEDVTLYVERIKGGMSGGTAASMMGIVEHAQNSEDGGSSSLGPFALYPEGVPEGPKQRDLAKVVWDEQRKSWVGPFIMAGINTRIVRRSNALLDFYYGEGFKYKEVSVLRSKWKGQRGLFGLGLFFLLLKNSLTRSMVRKFVLPSPGQGPSREQIETGRFKLNITGNTSFRVEVEAHRDPGYGATATMLGESAFCLAREDNLGPHMGVVTPASGMGMALIDALNQNGVTFKVLK